MLNHFKNKILLKNKLKVENKDFFIISEGRKGLLCSFFDDCYNKYRKQIINYFLNCKGNCLNIFLEL